MCTYLCYLLCHAQTRTQTCGVVVAKLTVAAVKPVRWEYYMQLDASVQRLTKKICHRDLPFQKQSLQLSTQQNWSEMKDIRLTIVALTGIAWHFGENAAFWQNVWREDWYHSYISVVYMNVHKPEVNLAKYRDWKQGLSKNPHLSCYISFVWSVPKPKCKNNILLLSYVQDYCSVSQNSIKHVPSVQKETCLYRLNKQDIMCSSVSFIGARRWIQLLQPLTARLSQLSAACIIISNRRYSFSPFN